MLKRLSLFMVFVFCLCAINVSASGETYEYYFEQLTADEKEIYSCCLDAVVTDGVATFEKTVFNTKTDGGSDVQEQLLSLSNKYANMVANSFAALTRDHPKYFWLGSYGFGYQMTYSDNEGTITFNVTVGTLEDLTIIDSIDEVIKSIGATGSDYDKVKTIHEYLCNNIDYSYTDNAHTIAGALLEGEAVCEGYAEAFKAACDYYGIKCVCVEGVAYTETGDAESHMWNYVQLDGSWYALDATWDDQSSGIYMDFFLVGADTVAEHFDGMAFSESHIPNRYLCGIAKMEFAYPSLSSSAYDSQASNQSGWVLEYGNWVFYENGVKATNTWKLDSVGWCYLTDDGTMATNEWILDSVGWCYVGSDGYCITDTWMQDSVGWCYLDSNGRMATNTWILDSVGWCYVGSNGYCVTNSWMADSVGWVYLDAEGRMATNQWIMDSVGWCYVGSDGYAMTNCWMADSIGWCYLDSNGRMVVNDYVYDSNGKCWLDANGYWDGIYY